MGDFLEELFNPPKFATGDRVMKKDVGRFVPRKLGRVLNPSGWFAVVQWDGEPKPRRESIHDLLLDNS